MAAWHAFLLDLERDAVEAWGEAPPHFPDAMELLRNVAR
jgi:phosphoserine phosphatase